MGSTLAFDFGLKRIGVAQGSAELKLAHPLMTICEESRQAYFEQIHRLIQEWQPVQLVVGLPMHMDGTHHDMTARCLKFGRRLYHRFGLPIYWADERLSSVYADSLLAEAGVLGRKRKQALDQVAAQAILYTFFESGAVSYYDGHTIDHHNELT